MNSKHLKPAGSVRGLPAQSRGGSSKTRIFMPHDRQLHARQPPELEPGAVPVGNQSWFRCLCDELASARLTDRRFPRKSGAQYGRFRVSTGHSTAHGGQERGGDADISQAQDGDLHPSTPTNRDHWAIKFVTHVVAHPRQCSSAACEVLDGKRSAYRGDVESSG